MNIFLIPDLIGDEADRLKMEELKEKNPQQYEREMEQRDANRK